MIRPGLPTRALCALAAAAAVSLLYLLQRHQQLVSIPVGLRHRRPLSVLDDINNSTLGFQAVFVVGLPSRTDRRDAMVLQAALSHIDLHFVDGVVGSDVLEKAVPKTAKAKHLHGPNLGSWRGHMNAIQEVVRRNLSSALILEDDCDWDIRLRQQLHDFALSAHALTQPLRDSPGSYADATYPTPSDDSPSTLPDMAFDQLPATVAPASSPYGQDWDLLWLGHCGMQFPLQDNKVLPKGRVIHQQDLTVPQKKHLWSIPSPFTLKDKYPDHTRAVHHVQEGVCSLGYAVSRAGAQKLLRDVGLREVTDAFDILLRFFCEGTHGRAVHNCLTTQPGLFQHHRPVGLVKDVSDIGNHGDGFRSKALTDMVRWSVRLNADVLMSGGTAFIDQFPDVP